MKIAVMAALVPVDLKGKNDNCSFSERLLGTSFFGLLFASASFRVRYRLTEKYSASEQPMNDASEADGPIRFGPWV